MKLTHTFLNCTNYKGEQLAKEDNRRAELWRKWREAQSWGSFTKGQHGRVNEKAVNQYHSIELLKLGE